MSDELDLSGCVGVETPDSHTITVHGYVIRRDLYSKGWNNALLDEDGGLIIESCHLAKVIAEAKRLRRTNEKGNS